MADETESAVAAWLDSPGTKREIEVVRSRFQTWTGIDYACAITDYQAALFALAIEILASIDTYGSPITLTEIPPEPTDFSDFDDDDPPEPWRPRPAA